MSAVARGRAPILLIDWARCRGHGHCADLLPEMVHLDPWGYPVVGDGQGSNVVPAVDVPAAQRAVAWCPNLALRLVDHAGS